MLRLYFIQLSLNLIFFNENFQLCRIFRLTLKVTDIRNEADTKIETILRIRQVSTEGEELRYKLARISHSRNFMILYIHNEFILLLHITCTNFPYLRASYYFSTSSLDPCLTTKFSIYLCLRRTCYPHK